MKLMLWNKERTIVVITIIMVAIAAFGAWRYFYRGEVAGAVAPPVPVVPAPIAERMIAEGIAGENTREYTNEKFKFSLHYPQSLTVKEYDEEGGAMSVTFQSEVDDNEFQIYVTPYADTQITDARFRLDVPSGVRSELVDIIIGGGTRATMFFSTNSLMGETREVWFIKGGSLYEIVTYKELDAWLAEIMKSWKFL